MLNNALQSTWSSGLLQHSNALKYFVHQCCPLVSGLHEVLLRPYDDLGGQVIQWQKD